MDNSIAVEIGQRRHYLLRKLEGSLFWDLEISFVQVLVEIASLAELYNDIVVGGRLEEVYQLDEVGMLRNF